MTKQVRVNIRTVLNTKKAKTVKINGRDVIKIPSATLPDDIVMNGIMYPADEIEKSFLTLNRTPAPYGHPMVNGQFVSARDPEGINVGYIGAWNDNARQVNGRVELDKFIDVEVAGRSNEGQEVLDAIEAEEPIHTSNALLCDLDEAEEGEDFEYVARNMVFDHDAILLNEEGAATPEQGVGLFVNSQGQEIEVINSFLEEMADTDLEYAADQMARALERRERASVAERILSVIKEAFATNTRQQPANEREAEMADNKQLDDLSAKLDGLAESMGKLGDTFAEALTNGLKPLTDSFAEMQETQKAAEEKTFAENVAKVVKANILTEDEAKAVSPEGLASIAARIKTNKKAAGLNAADADDDGAEDEFKGYSVNSHIEEAMKKNG